MTNTDKSTEPESPVITFLVDWLAEIILTGEGLPKKPE